MDRKETDISLIRRYLDGKLDTKAMHLLEKQAQHDPFLMDAMEGYEMIGSDQQVQLNELSDRLKKRVGPKKASVIPFRLIGIAASVLIVCSAGIWWLNSNRTLIKPAVRVMAAKTVSRAAIDTPFARIDKPAEKIAVTKVSEKRAIRVHQIKPLNAAAIPQLITSNALTAIKVTPIAVVKDSVKQDTTPVDEMIAMGYTGKKNNVLNDLSENKALNKADSLKNPVQPIIGRAPGVQIQNSLEKPADMNQLAKLNLGGVPLNQLVNNQNNKDKIAKDDGLPVKGATAKAPGNDKTAKSNAKGYFNLNADSSQDKLIAGGAGYRSKQVSANRIDSVKTKASTSNSDALSEVVVTGYTSKAKDGEEATIISAHPQTGWGDFRKYLKNNAVSPDGKTGVVKLSFIVDKYGSISAIKIIKGISEAANKKAVDIIKSGPDWDGNTDKHTEKIKVTIRFKK